MSQVEPAIGKLKMGVATNWATIPYLVKLTYEDIIQFYFFIFLSFNMTLLP